MQNELAAYNNVVTGLCLCGCGQPAPISAVTETRHGWLRGHPKRFISGHNARMQGRRPGEYVKTTRPDGATVSLHIVMAERALGKPLPVGAQVHHVNGDPGDNRPENLVICQDQAYHKLLHQRQRALEACGNPNWRKCNICKQYDDPSALVFLTSHDARHRECRNVAAREWLARPAVRSRACDWCGSTYTYKLARKTTCSRSCGNALAWSRRRGRVS